MVYRKAAAVAQKRILGPSLTEWCTRMTAMTRTLFAFHSACLCHFPLLMVAGRQCRVGGDFIRIRHATVSMILNASSLEYYGDAASQGRCELRLSITA